MSNDVRSLPRLAQFALFALGYAAPVWLLSAAVVFGGGLAQKCGTGCILTWLLSALACNVAANIWLRAMAGEGRKKLVLRAGGVLGLAALWALLAGYSLATSAGIVAVAFAAVVFIGTHCVKEARSRARLEFLRRRLVFPSALRTSSFYDVDAVLDALESTRAEAATQPERAAAHIEALHHQLTRALDPRFETPLPLPAALGYLTREMDVRTRAEGFTCKLDLGRLDAFPADRFVEPALVCAIGYFAARFGAFYQQGGTSLQVRYDAALGQLFFQLDLKKNDLWFVLPAGSPVRHAKEALVALLNRLAATRVFETSCDSAGRQQFRFSPKAETRAAAEWADIESQLGTPLQLVSECADSLGMNRVYQSGSKMLKVERDLLARAKRLSLAEEFQVLRRLDGLAGVPQGVSYESRAGYALLTYDRIEGQSFVEYLRARAGDRQAWFRSIVDLNLLLASLHARGVLHRDLNPGNVLVQPDGRVALIDFDQAVAGAKGCGNVDLAGVPVGDILPCVSVQMLIERAGLAAEYATVSGELQALWTRAGQSNANSPGVPVAYHHWFFGALELPGEREWIPRWQMIHAAIAPILPGARVIDMGCNMGILAVHLKLYGAAKMTGVELHDDMVGVARDFAKTAGVEVTFHQADLNRRECVEPLLAETYDLAIALSVVHWLEHREHVLELLRRTPHVLYEGHSPPSEELALMKSLGFTDVRIVGYSERLRGLYLASR